MPAPNSYELPKLTGDKIPVKGAAASWTMTARSNRGKARLTFCLLELPLRQGEVLLNEPCAVVYE